MPAIIEKPKQPKPSVSNTRSITNGITENPPISAGKPKVGGRIGKLDQRPNTIVPRSNVVANVTPPVIAPTTIATTATVTTAAATATEEVNPKKSGIRIKYSGINNGAKRLSMAEQGNSSKLNLPKQEPAINIPSNVFELKENIHAPAVTPKANKNTHKLENSYEELVNFADIDDIELPDGTKIGFPTDLQHFKSTPCLDANNSMDSMSSSMSMNESSMTSSLCEAKSSETKHDAKPKSISKDRPLLRFQKHKNHSRSGDDDSSTSSGVFKCRHCGKRYRWKSTLRRHENDECGNKEPAHECPYCPYKAKQRGNLGVHVRKHHADKPELESKRKRRTL